MGEPQAASTDKSTGLVVVDPVRAFTDPEGVIGRHHGAPQFGVITDTVARLSRSVAAHAGPKIWIRPQYRHGQFTEGDLDHWLAQLCADPDGPGCEWHPCLTPPPDATVVRKADIDACSSSGYLAALEDVAARVEEVAVCGFWLNACVAATALSTARRLEGRTPVLVPTGLAATIVRFYSPGPDGRSVVGATLDGLKAGGVVVCEDLG